MQGRFALHGIDKRHIVYTGRQFGEQLTDPAPRLAVLSKFPVAGLAVARLGSEELKFSVWIKGLARSLLEFRFVVERIDLAHSAGTKDLDDSFGVGLGETLASSGFFGRK